MRNQGRTYPNGYLNKIQYWAKKLSAAIENNSDLADINYTKSKLDYFIGRQEELEERNEEKI